MTVFPLFLKKFFAFAPIIHPGEEKSHPAGDNHPVGYIIRFEPHHTVLTRADSQIVTHDYGWHGIRQFVCMLIFLYCLHAYILVLYVAVFQ